MASNAALAAVDPRTTEHAYYQSSDAQTIIQTVSGYLQESTQARRPRIITNRINMDMYMGIQDYSEKIDGQSREFLPKVATAVEQMAAFVKKGLVQFGDWFSVEMSNPVIDALMISNEDIRAIMQSLMNNLATFGDKRITFPVIISDAVKDALLNSLIILKVHGCIVHGRNFQVERGYNVLHPDTGEPTGERIDDKLSHQETHFWRPRIDLVKFEDFYRDPSGRNLYEIHRCERDYHEILEYAEAGTYELAAVKSLLGQDTPQPRDDARRQEHQGQQTTTPPGFRKRITLDEVWGTLLDENGRVAHRNIVTTIANQSIVIRAPEPNPFWHQESPFVVAPLIRVPHSVFHKALYDHASPLNIAINEIFNLMLDGGLAAVWGIKQVRMDALENPQQVEGGIAQGTTLAVNTTLPPNAKVVETCVTGVVPQEAQVMFEVMDREFAMASLTNQLKLGALPPGQIKATAVVEQQQSQSVTLDGILGDLEEEVMEPTIRKLWLAMLQNLDDMDPEDIFAAATPRVALTLLRLKAPQRFALFAKACDFQVRGLTGTMNRIRDFQRIMAYLQVLQTNPILAQDFLKKFSPSKTNRTILKFLNINPNDIERDDAEAESVQQDFQDTARMAQVQGGGAQGGTNQAGSQPAPAQDQSNIQFPAEIAQQANPLSGMSGG